MSVVHQNPNTLCLTAASRLRKAITCLLNEVNEGTRRRVTVKVTGRDVVQGFMNAQAHRGTKGEVSCRSLVGLADCVHAIYFCFDAMT